MPQLIVGLDPVALLRESRRSAVPDPAAAAVLAELAGADGLSIGMRTDRRHGQERDLKVLRAMVKTRLQVRVPPTPDSIRIVTPIRPDAVVLVPERPESLAHETGFDLTVGAASLGESASALREAGEAVDQNDVETAIDSLQQIGRLLTGLRREQAGLESDPELGADVAMLEEYVALLSTGAIDDPGLRTQLAESLLYASRLKVLPPPFTN